MVLLEQNPQCVCVCMSINMGMLYDCRNVAYDEQADQSKISEQLGTYATLGCF
jgi:hypothetical protein